MKQKIKHIQYAYTLNADRQSELHRSSHYKTILCWHLSPGIYVDYTLKSTLTPLYTKYIPSGKNIV